MRISWIRKSFQLTRSIGLPLALAAAVLVVTALTILLPTLVFAVPAQGHEIMYAGPSPFGPEVARDIVRKGGNVVDAAVAIEFSQAVTGPYFASLGGGGFAMVKMNGKIRALDFREVAPGRAGPDLFKDKAETASLDGGLAVGVPGIPAGLWELHRQYGKLKWSQLFAEALRLANQGFRVSGEWVEFTNAERKRFNAAGSKIFTKAHGASLLPGDLLKQPEFAKLLRLLQAKGAPAFYEGAVARDIVAAVNDGGGIFRLEDLADYKIRWLEPIKVTSVGHTIYSMPPPSSGGIVIAEALKMMEKLKINSYAPLSVDEAHLLIEIMKLSFKGRSELGDPTFVDNPVDKLLADDAIAKLAASVKMDRALEVEKLKEPAREEQNTTHFSVMDGDGNVVAMTITLNDDWGSGVVTKMFGIALNNEMDDFTTRPGKPNMFGLIQGKANAVHAGARPLSSMSPTIVEKDGRTVLALGAPGGPRIITAVLQVIYRMLRGPYDIDQAVQAPRVHHQFLPNKAYVDALRFAPEVLQGLRARGHVIEESTTGKAYGIARDEKEILSGAADARGEGAAGGM